NSSELHLAEEKYATANEPDITKNNVEKRLWLRVERQTLRRLPVSGGVLFTIRTYVYPMVAVMAVSGAPGELAQAIRSLSPNMQKYKNLLPFRAALLKYLDSQRTA
ncbi:MAG: heme-dependent oxidative N-demethylase subunit alpha family protein, partial [Cyanobacteria bacterium J06576_12]